MTTFIVNGKHQSVEYMDNGIDISADFVGNTHHGMGHDEDGNYIASQEDYDWWVNFIDACQEMERLIETIKEEQDDDEVDRVVQDAMSVDMEDQPAAVTLALEEAFGK